MFNEELTEKIKRLYSNDEEKRNKILEGDTNVISTMTSNINFTPDMIVKAFEEKNIDNLYEEAKRRSEIIKLYHDLCIAYSENNISKKI